MKVAIHDSFDLTKEEQRIFNPSNFFSQLELFPKVTSEDIMITLFYLKRYRELELRVKDYEDHQEDLRLTVTEGEAARRLSAEDNYANKTCNAVIIYAEKQPAIYAELKRRLSKLQRAFNLIRAKSIAIEDEVKRAVQHRYFEGHEYKTCLLFFKVMSPRTFDRRLAAGVVSMANTLKAWGELEREWEN